MSVENNIPETKTNQSEAEELKAQFKKFDEEVTKKQKKQEQKASASGNLKTQLENQVTELKQTFLAFPADPQSAFLNKPYSAEELAQLPTYLQLLAKANPIEARRKELEEMKRQNPQNGLKFPEETPKINQPETLSMPIAEAKKKEKAKPVTPLPKKKSRKSKKLEEYTQTKPEELLAFETKEEEGSYSNNVPFYDSLPKYWWGKQKRTDKDQPRLLKRTFVYQGIQYKISIQPAVIEEEGIIKVCFPSEREELVEEALRKLACDGKSVLLDDETSVIFTLYEVQQELKRIGHSHNISQIKEAIMVCNKSNIEIKSEDGEIMSASFFPAVGLQTKENWKGEGKKTKAYVVFNPLVTQSIHDKTFRLSNYNNLMGFHMMLSRWFYKRIAYNYTQASATELYTIKLSTIIRDSGMKEQKKIGNNLQKVKQMLNEMIQTKILAEYKFEEIYEGRKLIDVKFALIPHEAFIAEVKYFNKRQNETKKLLKKG